MSVILVSPGNVLFSIGGFEIYTYGAFIAFAILLGTIVSNCCANRVNILPKDVFISIIPLVVICGLIGARLWYCLLNLNEFSSNYMEILNLRNGGISIHGAILGGFIFLLFYSRLKKISLINLCDFAVLGLSIGQVIGRWGNFFNNEAFGRPCEGFLKLFIPQEFRPYEYLDSNYFHPTFLYESISCLVIFCLLKYLLFQKKVPSGFLTITYLLTYSFARFVIEFIRIDSNVLIIGMPFPAIVSVIIFFVSLIFLKIKLIKLNK